MSHRSYAAVASSAALLAAFAGGSPALATTGSSAKLASSSQTALVTTHAAIVRVTAPAKSVASVELFSGGLRVSTKRKLVFKRARTVKIVLPLTSEGVKRLRDCGTRMLGLRLTIHNGGDTNVVRERRALELDSKRCNPAPASATQQPAATPATEPAAPAAAPDAAPETAPAPEPAAPTTKPTKPTAQAPLFRVGTAVVDISPQTAMPVGGYGANYLVTNGVHDPLQVRAFFVGKGKKAVTFVSVDSQGWFAAYQTPNVGDGAADARNEAAAALTARGYDATAANVVVSATHDHAAPTIMGIWGHTDPAYLHSIKVAAVKAVLDAEANARDAELWAANGTIKGLVSQVQGTDQMAGFAVDTDLPILWAREPGTGATLATYIDVPTHVDQYNPINSPEHQFSADYPGWVRDRLAELLGGTSVIAQSTLGRQESIGADSTFDEVAEQGRFITNQVMRALRNAHRITDPTLAARTQSFSTVAENMGLLAAMSCNHVGGPLGCPGPLTEPAANNGTGTWNWSAVGGIFTVNRSLSAPWFTPTPAVGTSATVARVGDQLYATAPGEAFPEVTSAAERMFEGSDGIRDVHIINHAGDQLGYYWDQRPGIYPSAQLAQSDFARFNVSSHLAQDNVDALLAAGQALGLAGMGTHPYAEIDNPNAFSEPTIQFYSNQVETADTGVSFYATSKKAQAAGSPSTSIGSSAATQSDGKVAWDFGDGTVETQTNQTRFTHTFPEAGTYRVQASVTDNLGKTYRWVQMVKINAPLSAGVVKTTDDDDKGVLTARAIGGQRWDVLAAHWTFSNGTTDDGTSVTAPVGATTASVTIVDGAGNTASTTVPLS